MFFQELPGVSSFKLYPSNSLLLLSHIPVERSRSIAQLLVRREVSVMHYKTSPLRSPAVANSVDI